MTGIIEIDDKSLIFEFSNFELTIYDKQINRGSFFEDIQENPYGITSFNGKILSDNKTIVFYTDHVLENSYSLLNDNFVYTVFSVTHYIVGINTGFNAIRFNSTKNDRFYGIQKINNMKKNNNGSYISPKESKKRIDLVLSNKKVTLEVDIAQISNSSFKYGETISVFSVVSFIFEEIVNPDDLLDYYFLYVKFMRYISFDVHLEVSDIALYNKYERNNDSVGCDEAGNAYFRNYYSKSSDKNDIMKFDNLENGIKTLLENIYDGQLYLEHISNTIDENFGYYKYGYVLQCFEEQYSKLGFPISIEVNEKKKIIKDELLEFINNKLEDESYTGKKREELNKWKDEIKKTEHLPLSNKIMKMIDNNEEIMEGIKKYLYFEDGYIETNKIVDRIVYNRNKISHGEIEAVKNKYIIADYYFMLYLCYTIVLKNIGLETKQIKNCLEDINLKKLRFNRIFRDDFIEKI